MNSMITLFHSCPPPLRWNQLHSYDCHEISVLVWYYYDRSVGYCARVKCYPSWKCCNKTVVITSTTGKGQRAEQAAALKQQQQQQQQQQQKKVIVVV